MFNHRWFDFGRTLDENFLSLIYDCKIFTQKYILESKCRINPFLFVCFFVYQTVVDVGSQDRGQVILKVNRVKRVTVGSGRSVNPNVTERDSRWRRLVGEGVQGSGDDEEKFGGYV